MTRLLVPLLVLATAASAVEAAPHHPHADKGDHPKQQPQPGQVLGRESIDAGHVLEARSVPGHPGQVLIRWGDVDNVIKPTDVEQAKAQAKAQAFSWSGSAAGMSVELLKRVAFEDGSKPPRKEADSDKPAAKKDPPKPQDRITDDGKPNTVTWETRTFGAWDGVLVEAKPGSTLAIVGGPLKLSVTVP
jgi:hypothetical protein